MIVSLVFTPLTPWERACTLQATIDRHKSGQSTESANYSAHTGGGYGYSRGRGRGRGGGTGPHKQYVRPGLVNSGGKGKENAGVDAGATAANVSGEKVKGGRKEVIIGGVAFEASRRSLVRKDGGFCLCIHMTYGL